LQQLNTLNLDDTDRDGVPDIYEDIDGDGDLTDDDTDRDGIPDYLDEDDDGDGIPTSEEVTDGETFGGDVDNDGIPNYLDTDSDGDGLTDENEGTDDHDDDGIPDYLDPDDWSPCTEFDVTCCLDVGDCYGQFIPMGTCTNSYDGGCLYLAIIEREWHPSYCGSGSGGDGDGDGDDGGQNPKFGYYSFDGPTIEYIAPSGGGGVYYEFWDSYDCIWEGEETEPISQTVTAGDLRYDGENPFYFLVCNGYSSDIEFSVHFTIGCQDTYTGEPMPGFTLLLVLFALSIYGFVIYKNKKNMKR